MSCVVNISVVQKDGVTPAPFAAIKIFKVARFLWWDVWLFDRGLIADFYGKATVTIQKGVRYVFKINWTGADGKTREWNEPLIAQICPWPMTARAPW